MRDPGPPGELPRQQKLDDEVLRENTFEGFSEKLEEVHDEVHIWAGGSMSVVPTAAFDPIFWSHHAMIDRLWAIWQNSNLGTNPPAAILSTVLTPFPMTVSDVLSIERLGYNYAVQAVPSGVN